MEAPQLDPHVVVLLRRPPTAPELEDAELERIQAAHLAHMAELRARGTMLANGPFGEQADESLRGLCVMACGVEEAREAMSRDPAILAGRMVADVFVWWIPPGLARFGAS